MTLTYNFNGVGQLGINFLRCTMNSRAKTHTYFKIKCSNWQVMDIAKSERTVGFNFVVLFEKILSY